MARLIRRHSMERLELYDLDKITTCRSRTYQLPPPLPPPRKYSYRPSVNSTFERYQFLCNTIRSKTDPIYAATPMFTTIPQSIHGKFHRQLLGSYSRSENIKSLTFRSSKSPESTSIEIYKDVNEDDDDDDSVQKEDDKENDDNDNRLGSGSSDEQDIYDDMLDNDDDDDDDNKGIVETIYNRDKKNES